MPPHANASAPFGSPATPAVREARRVTSIYLLFACAWVFLSDRLVAALTTDPRALSVIQTYKGLAFVLLSGLILYLLLRQAMRALLERQRELDQSRGALAVTDERLRAVVESSPLAILLTDGQGLVRMWNAGAERMFGWKRQDVLGGPPPCVTDGHREEALRLFERARTGETLLAVPARRRRKDGQWLDVSLNVAPLRAPGRETEVLYIIADVTEEKQAKEAIQGALREREALLKEIHHRVKNNMQVVTSLVSIQARQVRPECREALREIKSRIVSMALVHEELYQSSSFQCVEMEGFLRKLAAQLFEIYGRDPARIALRVEAGRTDIGIDAAVPLGLILGELLANSLKHAFPEGSGEISVAVRTDEDAIRLTFQDNGRGLPEGTHPRSTDGAGFLLLRLLTEQLDGDFEVQPDNGVRYDFTFPVSTPPRH